MSSSNRRLIGARPFTGLARVTALGLRTSWVAIALATGTCVVLVVAVAIGVKGLYPSAAARAEYAATAGASVPSIAFNGRGYGLTSLGGITGVEVGFTGQLLFPLMGLLTAIRLTRREEETGRTELLTASRVGRLAPLAAATILLTFVALATGLLMTIGMAATGLPAEGSAWYAAGASACTLFFAAIGLLLGQLCQQAITARQLGIGLVLMAFLIRFIVDGLQWDAVWASPLGWLPEARAFDDPRAWPLAAYAVGSLILLAACTIAAWHRDAGAGVFAPRPGPARGQAQQRAWRLALALERTGTTPLLLITCLWTLFIGLFSEEMTRIIQANPSLLAAMGLERGTDLMAAMAATVMVAAAGTVGVLGASRLTAEESAGRLGMLLSTRCSRARLWSGWWATTLLSSAAVLVASALLLGMSTWAVSGERGALGTALKIGACYLPAVLLIAAASAVLAALGPRWPVLGWAIVLWMVVVGFLAEALDLPEWARDLSPAHLVGVLPVDDPDPQVIAYQGAAAATLLPVSLLIFRRRSLRAG
ncbi:ABC transporter permease [Actinomyces sp.]|uniref:ABC transporter permease n=1 Tax=Actinomyces sp. TaxID=29317 RepID=UPI0026DB0425|nr:ABC transporter [Actinomyces sp.]MDO4899478.1 ABC transporter [Actinomyces sp.]